MGSAVVFWLLALLPGLLHLVLLWAYFHRFRDRRDLISRLLDNSVKNPPDETEKQEIREKQRNEWQPRLDLELAFYLFPVFITSLISIGGVIAIFNRHFEGHNYLGLPVDVFDYSAKIPTLAASAGFVGAYVWGLYDFVDRFRILSLPPSALHMIWFRLVLGAVLGEFATQLIPAKGFAPALAFALASIPVPSILKWLQDIASWRFGIGGQTPTVPPQWELVQGLTPDIISRLNEAGISSVAHLGNQDPVRLLRSTNIEWRNILDMMDQAFLASFVGDKIHKLRVKGIRGAFEMGIVYSRFRDCEDRAVELVDKLQVDLGTDKPGVLNLARNLYEDAAVERIRALWQTSDLKSKGASSTGQAKEEPRAATASSQS